jgi:uncharacterized protein with HEPN domain
MWRDQAYLLDMLTAAGDARDFAVGLTRDEYEPSRLAHYAAAHALQIIGEAASQLLALFPPVAVRGSVLGRLGR